MLLNHLSRQTKAVLLLLVVVLGNGGVSENVRNIKTVLLNCFVVVEGHQEILGIVGWFSFVKMPCFLLGGLP